MIPKIYQCLANDELRPVMCHAFIGPKEVAASDAHILVIHATADLFPADFIKTIPEDGLYFGRSLLVDLSKPSATQMERVKMEEGRDLIRVTHTPKGQAYYNTYHEFKEVNAENGFYPSYHKVLPEGIEPLKDVCIKPTLLERLMKAMASHSETQAGYATMKLTFYGDGKAIMCKPLSNDYPSCRGLIMPVMEST